MLHRSKAKEPSSLTIVPYTESESAVANAPAPGQSESRGPSPQPMVAPTAQAPAISVLKANRKRVFMGAAAAALLAAGWLGFDYLAAGRFMVTTDDAYVRAYNTTLGAKVAGYVSEFVVDDNVKVRAGDVIARVDDGDYRLAANAARDKIATQEATIERFDRQIDAQRANVEQTRAQLVSAQAGQKRMQSEFERQQALAGKEFATKQTLEQSIANRDQAAASVQSAQAALDGAIVSVGVLQAQQKEAVGTLEELKTALAKAERDLSFTEIRAPVDGVVASVSPASGSVFSLLPPDNATGNFTKIVQRLSVRIRVPVDIAERGALRPGMSVVVAVNTKPGAVASVATQTRTAAN